MSRATELPGNLAYLVETIRQSTLPVQVVVPSCVTADLVARSCREQGVPLSVDHSTFRLFPSHAVAAQGARTGAVTPERQSATAPEPKSGALSARGASAGKGASAHDFPAHAEVSSGATKGVITVDPAPILENVIDVRSLPTSTDRVLTARIQATLVEVLRAGIDLPSIAVLPSGSRIPSSSRLLPGKALAHAHDLGLGEDVPAALGGPDGPFPAELRGPCANLLNSWGQLSGKTKVATVMCAPSLNHPQLLRHLASGIAFLLGAHYGGEVTGLKKPKPDLTAAERVNRLAGQLRLDPRLARVGAVAGSHVLLVGESWSEGWTMTVTGQLLLSAGAKTVRPFTLSTDIRLARRR